MADARVLTVCLASSREASELFHSARRHAPPRLCMAVTGFRNTLLEKNLPGGFKDDVLAAGSTGALNPSLRPGMIFLPETVSAPARSPLAPDAALREWLADSLESERVSFQTGRLLTVPKPVADAQEKARLLREGHDAVDMETHGIFEKAARAGARVAAIRWVSDIADERAEWDYKNNLGEYSKSFSRILFRILERYGTVKT